MELNFKRTLTYCYFLFMVAFLLIFSVKCFKLKVITDNDLEKPKDVITVNQLIEEKDVELIFTNEEYNNIFDYQKYKEGSLAKDSFFDNIDAKEAKEQIEEIINTYKTNLENGEYSMYGFPSTMDYITFFNNGLNELSYFKAKSIDDIYFYYAYIYIYSNYFDGVISVNNFDDILVKEYYSDIIDSYMYMKGYHLLICKKDGASIVYLSDYSEEQKTKAIELYNKIYNITMKIEENTETGFGKKDFFSKVSQLFSENSFDNPSEELTHYLELNNESASSFKEFYDLGLTIVTEELEITSGRMVEEFEKGCREIFVLQYDELVENKRIEKEVIHEDCIITTYGYHLYINEVSSIEALFVNDELLSVPSIVNFALFIEEYNNSDSYDGLTPSELFSKYLKALNDSNEEEKNKYMDLIYKLSQNLNLRIFDSLTMDNLESEFIKKYLINYTNYLSILFKDSFNYEEIDHNEAIFASCYNFYAQVFSVYASQNHFDYIRYKNMIDKFDNLDFDLLDTEITKEEIKNALQMRVISLEARLNLIKDKRHEYKYGLFEKLNNGLYNELMSHYDELEKDKE